MLRIVAHGFGAPADVLVCEPAPRVEPEPSGVVVRMRASAINPSDLVSVSGAYSFRIPLPFVPGFEGVGVIDAIDAEVSGLRMGQRVLPLGSAGGWQSFKALPAEWCIPVPDDLSDEQAATAYVNPLTARLILRTLAPSPGMLVAVNAANSAIGRILLRLLDAMNIRSLAIVRSKQAMALLADEPICNVILAGEPLPPLDGGFDAIGGDDGAAMAQAIRSGGALMHYGLLSGRPLPPGLRSVKPFWLRNWVHAASRAELRAAMAEVFDDIRSGLAATTIEACYPLSAYRVALAHNAQASRCGKILFKPQL
ncbi:zinc-dependent alcohol dehydrogenase family protein [Taklimakanibacter albus]|uniref:Zinc-dependent alcohol dehydrogenase family protein n=1 Tax=Taklimakanibacter albus TaxID=2800327 RepID=A0ACC5R3T2_9HYPH|nr:zinc-dependent alcohol dehydrogenase family protein [Aestuariivirga sp. YIM B02566]MBK1867023.1 zinc-dependent alcohol dehydrogenase family protein [Aestuariivirga sp. YIM B02566]